MPSDDNVQDAAFMPWLVGTCIIRKLGEVSSLDEQKLRKLREEYDGKLTPKKPSKPENSPNFGIP